MISELAMPTKVNCRRGMYINFNSIYLTLTPNVASFSKLLCDCNYYSSDVYLIFSLTNLETTLLCWPNYVLLLLRQGLQFLKDVPIVSNLIVEDFTSLL